MLGQYSNGFIELNLVGKQDEAHSSPQGGLGIQSRRRLLSARPSSLQTHMLDSQRCGHHQITTQPSTPKTAMIMSLEVSPVEVSATALSIIFINYEWLYKLIYIRNL